MSSDQLIEELQAMARAMSGKSIVRGNTAGSPSAREGTKAAIAPTGSSESSSSSQPVGQQPSVPSATSRQAFLDEVEKLTRELMDTRKKLGVTPNVRRSVSKGADAPLHRDPTITNATGGSPSGNGLSPPQNGSNTSAASHRTVDLRSPGSAHGARRDDKQDKISLLRPTVGIISEPTTATTTAAQLTELDHSTRSTATNEEDDGLLDMHNTGKGSKKEQSPFAKPAPVTEISGSPLGDRLAGQHSNKRTRRVTKGETVSLDKNNDDRDLATGTIGSSSLVGSATDDEDVDDVGYSSRMQTHTALTHDEDDDEEDDEDDYIVELGAGNSKSAKGQQKKAPSPLNPTDLQKREAALCAGTADSMIRDTLGNNGHSGERATSRRLTYRSSSRDEDLVDDDITGEQGGEEQGIDDIDDEDLLGAMVERHLEMAKEAEALDAEDDIADIEPIEDQEGVTIHDGVQTTILFRSTDPVRYNDMEVFGRWAYEEATVPSVLQQLQRQHQLYKKVFAPHRARDSKEKSLDLSPEEAQNISIQMTNLRGQLATQRQEVRRLQEKQLQLQKQHPGSAKGAPRQLQQVTEQLAKANTEKQRLKSALLNLKTTIDRGGYEDVLKDEMERCNNESLTPIPNSFIIPSFPLGGGVTFTQHDQLVALYKELMERAAGEEQHHQDQLLLLQHQVEKAAGADLNRGKGGKAGKRKLSQQSQQQTGLSKSNSSSALGSAFALPGTKPKQEMTFETAMQSAKVSPYLTQHAFTHCYFPEVPLALETVPSSPSFVLAQQSRARRSPKKFNGELSGSLSSPSTPASTSASSSKGGSDIPDDFPYYVSVFPTANLALCDPATVSRDGLNAATGLSAHHPMTLTIAKSIVFDAATAKAHRRALLIAAAERQQQGLTPEGLPFNTPKAVLSTFPLTVIMDPYRTGFEEEKELPLQLPQPGAGNTSTEEEGARRRKDRGGGRRRKKEARRKALERSGMVIAGRYQLLDVLGQATFSRAVRCVDLKQRFEYDPALQDYQLLQLPRPDPPVVIGGTEELGSPDHSRHDTSIGETDYDTDSADSQGDSTAEVSPHKNSSGSPYSPESYVQVCLKIINNTKEFFDQSLDEIRLLHLLNTHGDPDAQHFVKMYDYFYHREHTFIVTELLSDNLYEYGKYIRDNGEPIYFTVARVRRIARQILTALQFVHSLNLIHCDLKPENILFVSHRRCIIKVIDFGSSCFVSDHLSSYVQSRSYRAPEVILGANYDGRIDIWSLGAILVELITGEVLFQSETAAEMLARIVAVCGQPLPRRVLYEGRTVSQFVSRFGCIFEHGEKSDPGGEDCYYLYTPVHQYTTVRRRRVLGNSAKDAITAVGDEALGQARQEEAATEKVVNTKKSNVSQKEKGKQLPAATEYVTERAVVPFSLLHAKLAPHGILPGTEVMDFIEQCLQIDYTQRPTSSQLLQHPFVLTPDREEEVLMH